MTDLESVLGARVAQARREAGLTQAQLAEKAGMGVQTISRMERGVQSPPLGRLEMVAQAVGVAVADLLRQPERPRTRHERAVARVVSILRARPVEEVERVADVLAVVWR